MDSLTKSVMSKMFVEHIEEHIKELIKKGELPKDSEVCCKICGKTITQIYNMK